MQCIAFVFVCPPNGGQQQQKKRHRIFSSQFTGSWCTRLHWVNMQSDGKKWKIEMKSNVNSRIEREKKHTQSLLECNGKIVFSLFLLIFTLNTEKREQTIRYRERKMLSNNRFEAMHFREMQYNSAKNIHIIKISFIFIPFDLFTSMVAFRMTDRRIRNKQMEMYNMNGVWWTIASKVGLWHFINREYFSKIVTFVPCHRH